MLCSCDCCSIVAGVSADGDGSRRRVREDLDVGGRVDLSGRCTAAEEELDALHRLQVVAGDDGLVRLAVGGGPLDRDHRSGHELLRDRDDLLLAARERVRRRDRRDTRLGDLEVRDVVAGGDGVRDGDVRPRSTAVTAHRDDDLDPGWTHDLVRAGVVGPSCRAGTAHRGGVAVLARDHVGVDQVHRLLGARARRDVDVGDDGSVLLDERVLQRAVGRVVAHLGGDNGVAVTVRAAHGRVGRTADLLLEREAGRRPLLQRAADDPLHRGAGTDVDQHGTTVRVVDVRGDLDQALAGDLDGDRRGAGRAD